MEDKRRRINELNQKCKYLISFLSILIVWLELIQSREKHRQVSHLTERRQFSFRFNKIFRFFFCWCIRHGNEMSINYDDAEFMKNLLLWWWFECPNATFNVHIRTIKRKTESVKIIQRKIISVIEFSGAIQRRRKSINIKIFPLNFFAQVLNSSIWWYFSTFLREIFYFIPRDFFLEHIQVCTFEAIWSIWP